MTIVFTDQHNPAVTECAIPTVTHGVVAQNELPIGTVVSLRCADGYFDPYNGDVRCTDVGTISHSNIACSGMCTLFHY